VTTLVWLAGRGGEGAGGLLEAVLGPTVRFRLATDTVQGGERRRRICSHINSWLAAGNSMGKGTVEGALGMVLHVYTLLFYIMGLTACGLWPAFCQVSFRVGEIEPLYCSLALYWIEYKWENKYTCTVNVNNSGRISEAFPFEVRHI
jgi:hypothetical protein